MSLRLRPGRSAGRELGAWRARACPGAGRPPQGGLRARRLPGGAAASLLEARPSPQPLARAVRRKARRAVCRDRKRSHAPALTGGAPGHAGGRAPVWLARGDRAPAARQRQRPPRSGRRDGVALSRPPRRRGRLGRACRATSIRPHPRPRLPLSGLGGRGCRPGPRRALPSPPGAPLRGHARARRGHAAPGGRAGADQEAGALRLLPPALRHPRAGARCRRGGEGPRLGPDAAAPGAWARLERQLDRLLPHRPLTHRSGAQRPVPRALPERGDRRGTRHRPRLPPRHPRAADPPDPRALRLGALGAGGGLRLLPLALGGARLRQGPGAAAGRDRTGGALRRHV